MPATARDRNKEESKLDKMDTKKKGTAMAWNESVAQQKSLRERDKTKS